MNFESLNRCCFTTANPQNCSTSWDIGQLPLRPAYRFKNMTPADYRLVVQSKTVLDNAVYHALLEYLNNEVLCNNSQGMFPRMDKISGNFYVADESYETSTVGITGSIMNHFTECYYDDSAAFCIEQDYLGLEVGFCIFQTGMVEITFVDSYAI